jgi:3-keto steroid reductase
MDSATSGNVTYLGHTSSYVHSSNHSAPTANHSHSHPLPQYRELQPLLEAFHSRSDVGFHYPSRVLWTTSLEATHFYRPEDWQLVETNHSYEGSKYQTELVAGQLENQALRLEEQTNRPAKVRHVLIHPGCASTGIADNLLPLILVYLMKLTFYIVRPSLHGT